jgi:nitric oxide reductase subunit B
MPLLTGRKLQNSALNTFAFWTSNIGMTAMTVAFGIAGIAQVYLERKMGLDFLQVQKEIEVHFFGLILAATLFSAGIIAFVWNFIRFGKPKGEIM